MSLVLVQDSSVGRMGKSIKLACFGHVLLRLSPRMFLSVKSMSSLLHPPAAASCHHPSLYLPDIMEVEVGT